jgi:glucoamylase
VNYEKYAPGWPGIPARWTASRKTGVGTARNGISRVSFTISDGRLTEIYYPREDRACTRDMELLVTDGHDFFSDEKRGTNHHVDYMAEGVPAYLLVNSCTQGRYRIEKQIIADPRRDAVQQHCVFTPLVGVPEEYHVYALMAPHLNNQGSANTAWLGDHKGVPMLFAERNGSALAMACSTPWLNRSVGFVGTSDGWQELHENKRLTVGYERAENGNVALTGEIDLKGCGGTFVLAIGFGTDAAEAGHRALSAVLAGFEEARDQYIQEWQEWQAKLIPVEQAEEGERGLYRISTAVLRTHEAKSFQGGFIAGLSIPWGFAKGDHDLGGYHLVWPRDLVETAFGLGASGAIEVAHRVLNYLQATQQPDGHWPQNMWLDGTPYWDGVQMDETALPILMVDVGRRVGSLGDEALARLWPMVRQAAGYLVRNGPVTQQDRWEMDPGYSPFTLAAEVAALLAAADLADHVGEADTALYLREVADNWNSNIERWTYVTGTDLDRQIGIEGHYVRIASPDGSGAASPTYGFVPIKSRPGGQDGGPASYIVGPDALALVRFGLRGANDPRMVNTVKAIDALLKVDTPYGPSWRRYEQDQYGEHADGAPYDGTGIGRAWPLLTGERGHYELAAGRREEALKLLKTMEAFAGTGGLIPEQVWDSDDIPEHDLFCGRPSGSAMPLVWAHAEYVRLRRSIRDGRVFDMPPQPVQRYQVENTGSPHAVWRFNNKVSDMEPGKRLRLEVLAPAMVHWSCDGWRSVHDTDTRDTRLGVHVADLHTEGLRSGTRVDFTFYWHQAGHWEGTDFSVQVAAGGKL